MLQWHTKAAGRTAPTGARTSIDWGKDGTPERLRMGDLPATGRWVRLEVPVARLKLAPGTVIDGWAFTQHDGTIYWDRAGIETRTPQDGQLYDSLTAWVRGPAGRRRRGAAGEHPGDRPGRSIQRTDAQNKELRAYFVEHAYSKTKASSRRCEQARARPRKRESSSTSRSRRRWSFARRPASPSRRTCSSGASTTRAARRSAGRCRRSCRRCRRARRSIGWAWRNGWSRPNHPLTARVAVNRFWLQVFGTGIVKTAEDFGSQGEPPSHPELLDWLAVQFREDGWDVKRIMKRLVMSAAYRQSSRVTPETLAKDPANRLLRAGRGSGSTPRCCATRRCSSAGCWSSTVGGPSVKPPQPAGLWEAVGYTGSNTAQFKADTGAEKVHRRSLYTFWKRTSPPPQMTTFDAPSRESCTVRRERTNTPLQALLLMNEPQFVEAARGAGRADPARGGPTTDDRLTYMFRLVTARCPDAKELDELRSALKDLTAHYAASPRPPSS